MNSFRFLFYVVGCIALVSVFEACQTYRECRQHYKFDRSFCVGVLRP